MALIAALSLVLSPPERLSGWGVGYVLVGGREDYLKSVFEKTGVRGRRELVAKMFAEQHWPHYGDGDAFLDADAWFAQSRSTENPASTS